MIMKFVVFAVFLGMAWATPVPKPATLIAELKTPASTAKLTPVIAPLVAPVLSQGSSISYPILPRIAGPYPYSYSAPLAPVAYLPASYSIEQHGYNIAY